VIYYLHLKFYVVQAYGTKYAFFGRTGHYNHIAVTYADVDHRFVLAPAKSICFCTGAPALGDGLVRRDLSRQLNTTKFSSRQVTYLTLKK
jgi:hypothetical protein